MSIELIDKSFLKRPGNYIFQSLMAVVALVIILYFIGITNQAAIVASLGSSAFIVFAMPRAVSAQPRRLIGGNIVGLLCGILGFYIFYVNPLNQLIRNADFMFWVTAALTVGLSIFLMTITNTEHPPAAGVALGILVHEWSYQTIIFVLAYAVSLAIVKRLLRSYLKDLC